MIKGLRTHKGPLGLILAAVAGGLYLVGNRTTAEMVGLAAAVLIGAGYFRDDEAERDELGQYVRMPRP